MTRDELIAAMKAHDWFYAYSDDGDVYRRGHEHRRLIAKQLRAMDRAEAEKMFVEFAPRGFVFDSWASV